MTSVGSRLKGIVKFYVQVGELGAQFLQRPDMETQLQKLFGCLGDLYLALHSEQARQCIVARQLP